MATYFDGPKPEGTYAVPEFWVYVDERNHLWALDILTPEQAQRELAYRGEHGRTRKFLRSGVTVTRATWQHREEIAPTHTRDPVWHSAAWWVQNVDIWRNHGVRTSVDNPRLLAYFSTPEKACANIRTQIKPGRYLAKFFASVLNQGEINRMARWQETGSLAGELDGARYPLKFATTADEIRWVYERGPKSCMSSNGRYYQADGHHPVEAYAAGDLAVAYLVDPKDDGRVIARALCWPEQKVFGRVYPTTEVWEEDGYDSIDESDAVYEAMRNKLMDAGYVYCRRHVDGEPSFQGARLQRHILKNGYPMVPYLDGDWHCVDDDDCIRLHDMHDKHASAYGAFATNGFAAVNLNDSRHCGHCGTRFTAGQPRVSVYGHNHGDPQPWCEACNEAHAYICQGGGARFGAANNPPITVAGHVYSPYYVRRNMMRSGRTGDYHPFGTDMVHVNGAALDRHRVPRTRLSLCHPACQLPQWPAPPRLPGPPYPPRGE